MPAKSDLAMERVAYFDMGRRAALARRRGDEATYLHWFRYVIRAATGHPRGKDWTAAFDEGYRDVTGEGEPC